MSKPVLIVITGPTAVGKTGLAIEAAQWLKTEIISCDSRQIYREMNIGTARPSAEQLAAVRHHFIATHSIHQYYNASMFEVEVLERLQKLFKTYPAVIMTGGSGLYADAVCRGIDDLPTIDPEIRAVVLKRYASEGIEPLRRELYRIDPEYCRTADLQNPKRIFKALEVFYMTGKPYSSLLTNPNKVRPFDTVKIGLTRNRQELYNIIDQRVDEMITAGLEEEARGLYEFKKLNALNTVGYKQLFDYFDNKISLQQAIELIKRDTRRYAKRQLSWFARDNEIVWFNIENKNDVFKFIQNKLNPK